MSTRRASLNALRVDDKKGVNAGLWLDKYITDCRKDAGNKDAPKPKMQLVQEVSGLSTPVDYEHAITIRRALWEAEVELGRADLLEVEFEQRVVVGLGQSGVLETGITLDHTWGVPKLPGSSLKGVAAAAAHQLTDDPSWRKGKSSHDAKGDAHATLFGDLKEAGVVQFHDGWWLPRHNQRPLAADIVTPHHQGYYGGKSEFPTDLDSPIPSPLLTSFGRFLVPITGPVEWREAAIELLTFGLLHLGIGAKTAKGYGHGIVTDTTREARERLRASEMLTGTLTESSFSQLFTAPEPESLYHLMRVTGEDVSSQTLTLGLLIEKAERYLACASNLTPQEILSSLSDQVEVNVSEWFKSWVKSCEGFTKVKGGKVSGVSAKKQKERVKPFL